MTAPARPIRVGLDRLLAARVLVSRGAVTLSALLEALRSAGLSQRAAIATIRAALVRRIIAGDGRRSPFTLSTTPRRPTSSPGWHRRPRRPRGRIHH